MGTQGRVCALLLLLSVAHWAQASLVRVNRGLRVKKGQMAFLQEDDLQFSIPRERDACKVEVVLNEPITQRVGKLSPQVFDCHFLADEVKYIHNGCPLLDEDQVLLRLYRFTEMETVTEVFVLRVELTEPDCSVIKLGPRALEVPEFYGLSEALDGNTLSFHYERRPGLECTVRINTHDAYLPAHGQLVIGEPERPEPRGDVPHSFVSLRQRIMNRAGAKCKDEVCRKGLKLVQITKVSCDEFLLMGLRYQHLDPPSPDIDYISIRLDLTDTRSRNVIQSERTWIPVRIRNAIPNQPPSAAFMPSFLLEVDQFILTPLSTGALDAEDEETPRSLLVFNVTRPPTQGFITHLSDHTRPISSFTWVDLNDMLIAYQPPNASHTERRNYEVEFEVHDFFIEKSPPITVHISVRTADTNAPRVSWNMGLNILEGQSQPITWDQLQIVDNDNLGAVRLVTVDGLQHGRLTVRGGKGFLFSVSDLRAGVVRYHHDDSDTTKDFVVFRISDGRHSTRHKFPINVLPKDDSPPFLICNMVLEALEGQAALIRGSTLQASDLDSSDDYILFNISRPPSAGEITKTPGPGLTGYPVSRFLQRDLLNAVIYYRHLGQEVFEDSFEVTLSDSHDPPNLSEPQVVVVHITPVHDQLPREAPGGTRQLSVKETEVVHLTTKHLHFTDPESPEQDLTYTITTHPFSSAHGKQDAGKLFLVDSVPKFTKDPGAPVLRSFTQHAVNHMKVAYMPPIQDIGPLPQHVQFVFSVTNQQGGALSGICFNITVLPVDNQAPEVFLNAMAVPEGGEAWLTEGFVRVIDRDSALEQLSLALDKGPRHGQLWLDKLPLTQRSRLSLQDLHSRKVSYRHDGSETLQDDIVFIATDGVNSVDFVVQVKVIPVNDEVPVLNPGLRPMLECTEGQGVVITTEYIYATDGDSNDGRLTYMIARQPSQGVVQKRGKPVDHFFQEDIVAGIVMYKHTGGEIGLNPRFDTVTFVISDEDQDATQSCCYKGSSPLAPTARIADSLPVYDLNITVFPMDNQPPTIIIGEMFVVDEGGLASITVSDLSASDPDTPQEELRFILLSPPQFGYIENTLPSPGFEKSNTGISIDSFMLSHVQNLHVNYVQSLHERTEPITDQFLLCVTDGKHHSLETPFYIVINPTNDEAPDLLARNITVQEGQTKELDPSVLDAVDLDIPRETLTFTVVQPPQHGIIMNGVYGTEVSRYKQLIQAQRSTALSVLRFTLEDLTNGMTLMYMHDDSESMEDHFTIQLSDGKHNVRRQVAVRVVPVNDERPRIVRNNGVEVEMGETRVISGAVLSAEDQDTPADQLSYVFETLPKLGLLQKKEGLEWLPLLPGMNCTQEDVDMNLLRYRHTGSLGSQSQDSFTFHLQDGSHRSPALHFFITVKDMQKGDIAVFTQPLKIWTGERAIVTTDVLLAVDGTDKPEELLYVLTTHPASGHVEYLTHPGVPITSFSQMDVAANLVCYVHDNRATAVREQLGFLISNGLSSRNGSLEVWVEAADRSPPSLSRNTGLRVPEGGQVTMPPHALSLSDPDTPPARLLFLMAQPPQFGQLYLRGVPLSQGNFTQQDLDSGDLIYRHGGGPAQIDRFGVVGSDGTNQGFLVEGQLQTQPVFITIQVEALHSAAPHVVQLHGLWRAELLEDGRYGIHISSRDLRAEGPGDEHITFHILQGPQFGYLENTTTGQFIHHSFTQRDLNRRQILYVIDTALEALSDRLQFQVSDPLGSTALPQMLEFQWSRTEFSQAEYRVCEDVGTLSVSIVRKGNMAESSFVAVKVNEISASVGKDFTLSPSNLIQFDPGVSERSWRVQLARDRLEEGEEVFEAVLSSPVSTVLGSATKVAVRISDASTGQCSSAQDATQVGLKTRVTPLVPGSPPQHGSIQLEMLPFSVVEGWTRGESAQRPPHPQARLTPRGNGKIVRPSSVHRNGTDLLFRYHGIVSLRVEDDSAAPASAGKSARVLVTSRGQQRLPPGPPGNSAVLSTDISAAHSTPQTSPGSSFPRACVPELTGLLQFDQDSHQLLRCDGVSWQSWTPTEEDMGPQKCPHGWTLHGSCCYLVSRDHRATWSSAARACRENHRGSLVSVLSKPDMDWLWDFSGRKPFWIGLNDRENTGSWEWVGGEPVTFTNWKKGPPRAKRRAGKNCVLVRRRGKWQVNDCRKGRGHQYVCYIKT
ncbi:FRAS1-related extracellular matrix protein 1a [Amia ocellicauda]|uniref:FRAS1-related extracellular matrix protein 1a n=1 Tax=Amia ocellicauda TaxID=2972642 RepID=UPI00346390DF